MVKRLICLLLAVAVLCGSAIAYNENIVCITADGIQPLKVSDSEMNRNTDLIVCGLTVAGSILCSLVAAGWTYCKAKRLKFYETFFSEKVKAYSEFLDAVSSEVQGNDPAGIKRVIAAQMKVKLYCSEKALYEVRNVHDAFMRLEDTNDPENLESFGAVYDAAVAVFREDMHNCRKFKFE